MLRHVQLQVEGAGIQQERLRPVTERARAVADRAVRLEDLTSAVDVLRRVGHGIALEARGERHRRRRDVRGDGERERVRDDDERDAELDDLVEPAARAVRDDHDERHLLTSSVYVPVASFAMASVIFHWPASSAGMSMRYRPGPSVFGSSFASIGPWVLGPLNVARTALPFTASPF